MVETSDEPGALPNIGAAADERCEAACDCAAWVGSAHHQVHLARAVGKIQFGVNDAGLLMEDVVADVATLFRFRPW